MNYETDCTQKSVHTPYAGGNTYYCVFIRLSVEIDTPPPPPPIIKSLWNIREKKVMVVLYSQFHDSLPKSSSHMHWISLRNYKNGRSTSNGSVTGHYFYKLSPSSLCTQTAETTSPEPFS